MIKEESKNKLYSFFAWQNISVKLGAIALALLLWIFVMSENEYTITTDIPIEVRHLPARLVLQEKVPKLAKIRIRGQGRSLFKTFILKRFIPGFKLVLDLERISEKYDFILNDYFDQYPQKVVIPSNFEVNFVEVVYPGSIHISLDEYMVKSVPIKSRVVINPSPGYIKVGKPDLDSSIVTIAGAKNAIQSIEYVYTENDTFNNLDLPLNTIVSLKRKNNTLIEYSFLNINYSQDIQAISERIISGVPVNIKNNLKGLVVRRNPSYVSLTIVGGINYIAKIKPDDIIVFIDFTSQWSPKKQFYEPTILVPDEIISWKDLTPRNIELAVAKESI